jgi:hypothetical protein
MLFNENYNFRYSREVHYHYVLSNLCKKNYPFRNSRLLDYHYDLSALFNENYALREPSIGLLLQFQFHLMKTKLLGLYLSVGFSLNPVNYQIKITLSDRGFGSIM